MAINRTEGGIAMIDSSAPLPVGKSRRAIPAFRPLEPAPERLILKAHDGDCPAYLFKPVGPGPWPAALFLMDGFGLRPTIMEMAQRLADGGYLVLLPDLFYRRGSYEPLDVAKIFSGGNLRQDVFDALGASPTNAMIAADAPAFIDFLKGHPACAGGRIGVTGYCMSGGMSLTIAGAYPNEIAAAACFHGGMLVSQAPDSPHLLAPAIKGEVYVGGAETDEWCPPDMVADLDHILADAGVNHQCAIYKGTLHGWTMRDSPLYDAAAAERHWRELFALFDRTLGGVTSA